MPSPTQVAPGILRITDTCHTYLVPTGIDTAGARTAVLVDAGDATVLDHLGDLGVDRITHVLLTHHHRDQAQGLARLVEHGAEPIVPPAERELFDDVERFWAGRRIINDYQMTSDRDCLTASVRVAGVAPSYGPLRFGTTSFFCRPTPGHTPGSFSYVLTTAATRVAFSGDLIAAPGKVRSLAALQWSYTGFEGAWMTMYSCLALQRDEVDLLLPSHGEPMAEAHSALDRLVDTLEEYVDTRRPSGTLGVRHRFAHPYQRLSDHVLANRSSEANSYVLLSRTGNALVIDYGYDMTCWWPYGGARFSEVMWTESMPALAAFGVTAVEVALPTHYHDDHCASLNVLRDAYGTQLWIPANVAPILARPGTYDLPCQVYEPILADRVLPLGEPFRWHEYEITPYETSGHTRYAAGYLFHADGRTWFASGDQTDGRFRPATANRIEQRETFNYQYRNLFRVDDYVTYADLLRRLGPDVLLTGHGGARQVDTTYLDHLTAGGAHIVDLHDRLLPEGSPADSKVARIVPYRTKAPPGVPLSFEVEVWNPSHRLTDAAVALGGNGVEVEPVQRQCTIAPGGTATLPFEVTVTAEDVARVVLTAEVTVGGTRHGQHAEAIVELRGDA